ncbi:MULTISPECIES: peptidase M14 [Pantoea]|uniref:peptidase M14 n=1 Tax=Pantoea TaxID=53335 RepID=UPI001B30709A|nr:MULTISPECIES: peptidase M14 [Pantoea]
MEWVEVADSAVKIGLTALITSVASYLVLKKNHRHEMDKESRALKQAKAEESKANYSQFLTYSLILTQKYRDVSCDAQGSDYIEFLNIYNRIQITSHNSISLGAFNLLCAVNEFIVIRKNEQDRELLRSLRKRIDLRIGEFQCLAREYLAGIEK